MLGRQCDRYCVAAPIKFFKQVAARGRLGFPSHAARGCSLSKRASAGSHPEQWSPMEATSQEPHYVPLITMAGQLFLAALLIASPPGR